MDKRVLRDGQSPELRLRKHRPRAPRGPRRFFGSASILPTPSPRSSRQWKTATRIRSGAFSPWRRTQLNGSCLPTTFAATICKCTGAALHPSCRHLCNSRMAVHWHGYERRRADHEREHEKPKTGDERDVRFSRCAIALSPTELAMASLHYEAHLAGVSTTIRTGPKTWKPSGRSSCISTARCFGSRKT